MYIVHIAYYLPIYYVSRILSLNFGLEQLDLKKSTKNNNECEENENEN
jgi:hypothetical protein